MFVPVTLFVTNELQNLVIDWVCNEAAPCGGRAP